MARVVPLGRLLGGHFKGDPERSTLAPRVVRKNETVNDQSTPLPADATAGRDRVTVRRAPRIGAFLVVGGFLGFLATLIVTSLFEADPGVGFAASLAYFSLYGARRCPPSRRLGCLSPHATATRPPPEPASSGSARGSRPSIPPSVTLASERSRPRIAPI